MDLMLGIVLLTLSQFPVVCDHIRDEEFGETRRGSVENVIRMRMENGQGVR